MHYYAVILRIMLVLFDMESVTVTERSKACTVFSRSEVGIVGSNPALGMYV
jgi:hypothetical protein